MSVKQVPMWRVECDKCGDGDETEYWAWNDQGHAIDEWLDGDHFALPDGRAFHRGCIPWERCPELDSDEGHTWGGDGSCGEGCGRTVTDVLADHPTITRHHHPPPGADMNETENVPVCADCAATMPPQITGPMARKAFEETTHLGVMIRRQLGDDWADVYLELQSGFWAMTEEFTPERFAR